MYSYNTALECGDHHYKTRYLSLNLMCALQVSGKNTLPVSAAIYTGCLPISAAIEPFCPPSCLASLLVMGVSVEQWRATIGSYNAGKSCMRSFAHSSSSTSRVPVLLSNILTLMCFVATISMQSVMKALMLLILLSGDVERNPGPDIMGE